MLIKSNFQSIIITVLNGEKWVDSCMKSIIEEEGDCIREVSVFDDFSTDRTVEKLLSWLPQLSEKSIKLIVTNNSSKTPRGVGFGRNRAIEASSGEFLCFLDIDDEMTPCRCAKQIEAAKINPKAVSVFSCISYKSFQKHFPLARSLEGNFSGVLLVPLRDSQNGLMK